MLSKEEIARQLAAAHVEADPAIVRVIRLVSPLESESREPVKLLEVNPETPKVGVMPIAFGASPPEFPFPSVVVEVTPEEYASIMQGALELPSEWTLGETILEVSATGS
jgi:hypothetical protein